MGLWGLYWLHQCGIPRHTCRFYLLLAGADKETAFCCGRLFCFHQCGIPRHTCRFYWLLAGAVGKRQGISIPYPSPTPLLTSGESAAAGKCRLPRVYRDLVSLYPVQTVCPHFDISIGCLVFGLGLFAFQWISLGLYRTFFIGGGWTVHSCGYVAFCYGLSLGLPLTAIGTIVFCW